MFPRNEDFNNASRLHTKNFWYCFSTCFSYILKFERLFVVYENMLKHYLSDFNRDLLVFSFTWNLPVPITSILKFNNYLIIDICPKFWIIFRYEPVEEILWKYLTKNEKFMKIKCYRQNGSSWILENLVNLVQFENIYWNVDSFVSNFIYVNCISKNKHKNVINSI